MSGRTTGGPAPGTGPAGEAEAAPLVVGVDAGASRIRAAVLDESGRERGRAEAPTVGAEDPVAGIRTVAGRALRRAGGRPPARALCAGLAGAGDPEARAPLRRALEGAGLALRVQVTTDVEVAHFDAFGPAAGILLAAGTGSVAFGRGPDGREARTGGLGPAAGDEGSGWDLGRRALRAVARAADGRGDPTSLLPILAERLGTGEEPRELAAAAARLCRVEVAALAPLVLGAADAGDGIAEGLVSSAAAALAAHVTALRKELGPWPELVPLALAGGLLGAERLRSRVLSCVGAGVRIREGVADGARGAARLALGS